MWHWQQHQFGSDVQSASHGAEEQYNNPYDAPEDIVSEADHIFHNEVQWYHI